MRKLLHKIKAIVKMAKLISSDDTKAIQQGRFYYMGTEALGQIFVPYGTISRPPKDSELIVFSQNGHESNAIAFASHPNIRTLKNLKEGEVGLANYLTKSYILMREDGTIELSSEKDFIVSKAQRVVMNASVDITLNAPTVTVNGDDEIKLKSKEIKHEADEVIIEADETKITGDETKIDSDLSINGGKYDQHYHPQGNDSDGDAEQDTGPPMN